jgi:hypothetical protein
MKVLTKEQVDQLSDEDLAAQVRACMETLNWKSGELERHLRLVDGTVRAWMKGKKRCYAFVLIWLQQKANGEEVGEYPPTWVLKEN